MSNVRNIWYMDDLSNTRNVLANTTETGIQDAIVGRLAIVVAVGDGLNKMLKEKNPSVDLKRFVGAIAFRFPSSEDGTTNSTNIAFKENANLSIYPVVGEKVSITEMSQGIFMYKSAMNFNNNVNNNITGGFDEVTEEVSDTQTYTSGRDKPFVSDTTAEDEELDGGFTQQNDIVPLAFKPGDFVLEGRYSNFMTFTSEDDGKSPVIIIGTNKATDSNSSLSSNHSTIMITSNQKVVIPSFKRNISSFDYTKKEFAGKQMILMSDRVYIGSKSNEMFLMSNSHIHLSSYGVTSIDANDIYAKSNTVKIEANAIYIGNGKTSEPVAKADTLINILTELISILSTTTYGVAGAKTTIPSTLPRLKQLSSRLNSIASGEVRIS